MFVKNHTLLHTSLDLEECHRLLQTKLGGIKRFACEKSGEVYELKRNFGGCWGLQYKVKLCRIESQTVIEIYLLMPLDKPVTPSRALLLSFMIILGAPLTYLFTYVGSMIGIKFLAIIILPIGIFVARKIAYGKNKATPLDKEIAFFSKLFDAKILNEEKNPPSRMKVGFETTYLLWTSKDR